MSRVIVTSDAGDVAVEVFRGEDDGHATAVCLAGDWTTKPGRFDSLEDVVEEAGIHLDQRHGGAR
jgi:hypothetical protein